MNKNRLLCGILAIIAITTMPLSIEAQDVCHPSIGTEIKAPNGLSIKLVGKHQRFSSSAKGWDEDIHSPKSVNIHPNGKKYYVNSLEGCKTIAYDMATHEKLAVVRHIFNGHEKNLWTKPSGFYKFTHYTESNAFSGKPVESCFTHKGKYLWVPYYRRSFDINAQDPSAIAIIDTDADTIVKMMETGPLPKMIATSHDGKTVAVAHWGNNTVGLIDVSSDNPSDWHHKQMLVVDYVLPLNYSTTTPVDRDNGSGYALRGTVFTPNDDYLLVGCMGNAGGIAVIDLKTNKYLGRVMGMMNNVRHLVISNGYLYLSINAGGCIQRIKLDDFMQVAKQMDGEQKKRVTIQGWQTCQVGTGARTIELSPSGRYAFAACNNASRLSVVETESMKMLTSIDADSYPVGLDISDDGHYIIITSQGRGNSGGNAVDIYEVTYPEPETPTAGIEQTSMPDCTEADSVSLNSTTALTSGKGNTGISYLAYIGGGAVMLLITIGILRLKGKYRTSA